MNHAEPIAFVRKRYLERLRADAALARERFKSGDVPCPICDGRITHDPDCLCAKTIAEVRAGLR